MSYVVLVIAGLFEVVWAVGLKYTDGLSRPVPTAITACAIVVSMVLLGLATKSLPIGTAYAVWVGIGAVGTAIAGMVLFAEPVSMIRIGLLGLIVLGIVGLKLTSEAR